MVAMSGTSTPSSNHGVIEMFENDAVRILTRNGVSSPFDTT